MKKIFFDVTALRSYVQRHSQLSGIQRVSIMTIARVSDTLGADNTWLAYHDRATGDYKTYRCPVESTSDLSDYATLFALLQIRPSLASLPGMKDHAARPMFALWHKWMGDLNAWRGRKKYFKRRGLALNDWKMARARMRGSHKMSTSEFLEDVARPKDRLVVLDIALQPKHLDRCLHHANTALGMDVFGLLHDLIPLVTPQFVKNETCHVFHERLLRSTNYVTSYLANSKHTGRDLRRFLDSYDAPQKVTIVPLAQALVSDAKRDVGQQDSFSELMDKTTVPDMIQALTKTPYVLVVGTLEVRKNLWQLATVWDRLRKKSGRALPKLVFAGRRGWLNDDFKNLLMASGQLGGWVEIVEEPDDSVLSYLYRNCLFTVTVSFYEGWGLPIGESLAYGKTAVVSNTSAMPEVGGDLVEYCDPHDIDDIEAACLRLIDDPAHRRALEARIGSARLRSWDDVATDMLAAIA